MFMLVFAVFYKVNNLIDFVLVWAILFEFLILGQYMPIGNISEIYVIRLSLRGTRTETEIE